MCHIIICQIRLTRVLFIQHLVIVWDRSVYLLVGFDIILCEVCKCIITNAFYREDEFEYIFLMSALWFCVEFRCGLNALHKYGMDGFMISGA